MLCRLGVEVKAGEPLSVVPDQGNVVHLSQACLGESKKAADSIVIYGKTREQKLVLGHLIPGQIPQLSFDLVFDDEFELSHNWKSDTVHFAGYQSILYRVFLGHKQCFVSSDVGAGKMQRYAFHKEPAGGADAPNGKKERLLKIFDVWCDNVVDLLLATEEDAILRRDIYDRTPTLSWGKGNVTLLGDSVHALQPNLGQGGCIAIQDGYQLALELEKGLKKSSELGTPADIATSLRSYEQSRKLREWLEWLQLWLQLTRLIWV
ncbi:hypothetical protein ABKV19_025288 [Rosa sericea]